MVLIFLIFLLLQGKHQLLPYLLQKAEGGGGTSLPSLPKGGLVLHPLQEPRPVHLPQVLGGGDSLPSQSRREEVGLGKLNESHSTIPLDGSAGWTWSCLLWEEELRMGKLNETYYYLFQRGVWAEPGPAGGGVGGGAGEAAWILLYYSFKMGVRAEPGSAGGGGGGGSGEAEWISLYYSFKMGVRVEPGSAGGGGGGGAGEAVPCPSLHHPAVPDFLQVKLFVP